MSVSPFLCLCSYIFSLSLSLSLSVCLSVSLSLSLSIYIYIYIYDLPGDMSPLFSVGHYYLMVSLLCQSLSQANYDKIHQEATNTGKAGRDGK